jgi:hypothetical protein
MRLSMILAAAAIAVGASSAVAQNRQQAAGPQPNRNQEKSGSQLFPGKQPVPQYSTGSNNATASLQVPGGSHEPNAGNTGIHGSGGTGYGTNNAGAGMTR